MYRTVANRKWLRQCHAIHEKRPKGQEREGESARPNTYGIACVTFAICSNFARIKIIVIIFRLSKFDSERIINTLKFIHFCCCFVALSKTRNKNTKRNNIVLLLLSTRSACVLFVEMWNRHRCRRN